MGGVSVSNSNPAPLLSTSSINVSAIWSAQLQEQGWVGGRVGRGLVNTKSEQLKGSMKWTWRDGFLHPSCVNGRLCSRSIPRQHRDGRKLSAQGQTNRKTANLLWTLWRSWESEKTRGEEVHCAREHVSLHSVCTHVHTQQEKRQKACVFSCVVAWQASVARNDLLVSLIGCCQRGTICKPSRKNGNQNTPPHSFHGHTH